MNPESREQAKRAIAAHVEREWREDFGVLRPELTDAVAASYLDTKYDPAWRFEILRHHAPDARRVLDLASGFGTAVFHALAAGYEAFGVEPDRGKQALGRLVLKGEGLPEDWRKRILPAYGEALPFRARSFDAVLSYQTLEHVRDPEAVLAEWVRVIRPGGGIHLRCPDYSGTFEGHYLLPWLPFLPRIGHRWLLKALGRPLTGLEGITYVTRAKVEHMLGRIASRHPRLRLHLVDLEQGHVERRVQELSLARLGRKLPGRLASGLSKGYRLVRGCRRVFRQEKALHLWIGIEEQSLSFQSLPEPRRT